MVNVLYGKPWERIRARTGENRRIALDPLLNFESATIVEFGIDCLTMHTTREEQGKWRR